MKCKDCRYNLSCMIPLNCGCYEEKEMTDDEWQQKVKDIYEEKEMNLGESQIKNEVKWNSLSEEKNKFVFENEEQFFLTEKQANLFYNLYIGWKPTKEEFIITAKQTNLIKKSELQTSVDHVENMYKKYMDSCDNDNAAIIIDDLYAVIQLLKKDHPEFNK